MHEDKDLLEILAARAAQGSAEAAEQLREELRTQLVHMVRRALRGGTGNAAFDTWVLTEASQAAAVGEDRPGGEAERLIVPVAQRLCQSIMDGLRPCSPLAGSTVCGP